MAELHRKDVIELFGEELHSASRYLYPVETNESVESRVVKNFKNLRSAGDSITLVDGAFDVPHNSHEWYLRHCKLIGAFATLQAASGHEVDVDDLHRHMYANPAFMESARLAVTIDADEKIAAKKSGLAHKGGVARPIYPWIARADRLAGYHFALDTHLYRTVDLVTVEGDSIHQGTPLESSLALAAFLKSEDLLDTFIVYGEHGSTVDEAEDLGLQPVVVEEGPYEFNPQTGASWSSSSIIKRAQGEPAPIAITRPSGL